LLALRKAIFYTSAESLGLKMDIFQFKSFKGLLNPDQKDQLKVIRNQSSMK
jgi:hypothetical protein